jgi:hypothetical protein
MPLNRLIQVQQRLAPLKKILLNHPLYAAIDSLEALHVFMRHHVFAVWDFMSLLKALQQRLCSVTVPWLPSSHPRGCRFVNEIVLAEESDDDGQGSFISHFGLYHRSMQSCGASTDTIDQFLFHLEEGCSVPVALELAAVPLLARRFVRHTFAFIDAGNVCALASAFTFGREDVLPGIFQRIVAELDRKNGGLEDFRYYLQRHIGLDGDEHGPLANQLVVSLCGNDEERWQEVETAAILALEARRELWDGLVSVLRVGSGS